MIFWTCVLAWREKDGALEVARDQFERGRGGQSLAHQLGCRISLTTVLDKDPRDEDENDNHHEERANDFDQREALGPVDHGMFP